MPPKRPRTDKVLSVDDALKYRKEVLSQISVNIARIQDILLTEQQIRDLNDILNNQFKEKWRWEKRLLELNGPDFTKSSIKGYSDTSFVVNKHRYFGRAKELPDVVKLLEEAAIERNNIQSSNDIKKNMKKFNEKKHWDDKLYLFKKEEATKLLNNIKSLKFPAVVESSDSKVFENINYIPTSKISKDDLKKSLLSHKKALLKKRLHAKKL